MKDVKIIIGANYGDEGKGLVTNYFAKEAQYANKNPLVILHNGSIQRGHTVEYKTNNNAGVMRHVFRHFGAGTLQGAATYYADTFLIHPMEYAMEFKELRNLTGLSPAYGYYSPHCLVITPFDMLVDQTTKIWTEFISGEKSYRTCGSGTWCACEDRLRRGKTAYTITDFSYTATVPYKMAIIWEECLDILKERGVDIERIPAIKEMLSEKAMANAARHFQDDLAFFFSKNFEASYSRMWKLFDTHIFEGGQGLGLDKKVNNDYHTTSFTGLTNPYYMLAKRKDFKAEVCYVTRSYLTRHGDGPLENEVNSKQLNSNIVDSTNCFNSFQGPIRYGIIDKDLQERRINKDFALVENDDRFYKTLAVTHTNEYKGGIIGDYYSDNKYDLHPEQ